MRDVNTVNPDNFNETCSGYVVTALQDIKCNEEQIKNILYALIGEVKLEDVKKYIQSQGN